MLYLGQTTMFSVYMIPVLVPDDYIWYVPCQSRAKHMPWTMLISTLQAALHTRLTMLIPQKYFQNYIASFCSPKGDYHVTSGSALQSFHHCNCMFRSRLCFVPVRACFKTPEVASLQAKQNQNYINTKRAFHQSQQGPVAQDTCNRVSLPTGAKTFKLLLYGRFTCSRLQGNMLLQLIKSGQTNYICQEKDQMLAPTTNILAAWSAQNTLGRAILLY